MRVFISWSGKWSKAVASELRTWLPGVIQSLEPWMSDADISAGQRWSKALSEELDGTHIGILCVTRSNVSAPWLIFEAGAVSKAVNESRVIPYLIDLKASELPGDGPLPHFQSVVADEEGTFKMLRSVNAAIAGANNPGETVLTEDRLKGAFDQWWPQLKQRMEQIETDVRETTNEEGGTEQDNTREMIEETLELVREMNRRTRDGRDGRPATLRGRSSGSSSATGDLTLHLPTAVGEAAMSAMMRPVTVDAADEGKVDSGETAEVSITFDNVDKMIEFRNSAEESEFQPFVASLLEDFLKNEWKVANVRIKRRPDGAYEARWDRA